MVNMSVWSLAEREIFVWGHGNKDYKWRAPNLYSPDFKLRSEHLSNHQQTQAIFGLFKCPPQREWKTTPDLLKGHKACYWTSSASDRVGKELKHWCCNFLLRCLWAATLDPFTQRILEWNCRKTKNILLAGNFSQSHCLCKHVVVVIMTVGKSRW